MPPGMTKHSFSSGVGIAKAIHGRNYGDHLWSPLGNSKVDLFSKQNQVSSQAGCWQHLITPCCCSPGPGKESNFAPGSDSDTLLTVQTEVTADTAVIYRAGPWTWTQHRALWYFMFTILLQMILEAISSPLEDNISVPLEPNLQSSWKHQMTVRHLGISLITWMTKHMSHSHQSRGSPLENPRRSASIGWDPFPQNIQ